MANPLTSQRIVPRNDLDRTARRLDGLLERGEDANVLDALREIARGAGGISCVARRAGVNRTYLYKVLSRAGNPELRTLSPVLRTLGLRLAIRTLAVPRGRRRRRPNGASAR